jgi:hypothetical protein
VYPAQTPGTQKYDKTQLKDEGNPHYFLRTSPLVATTRKPYPVYTRTAGSVVG